MAKTRPDLTNYGSEEPMTDRTAMIVTVVGSSVGMAAVLLTVMTVQIGSLNTRIDLFIEALKADAPANGN